MMRGRGINYYFQFEEEDFHAEVNVEHIPDYEGMSFRDEGTNSTDNEN